MHACMYTVENMRAAGHAEVNGAVRASDFSAQKTLGVGVSLDTSFDALAATYGARHGHSAARVNR